MKFDGMDEELMEIKSPIEQAFFLAMKSHIDFIESRQGVQGVAFVPQHQVKINNSTYYLDFWLGILFDNDSQIKIAIECDGHDFHERTKKQARHDRQRERALTSEGYTVVRFTGSEIYEDPYKCADEVYSLALKKIRERQ